MGKKLTLLAISTIVMLALVEVGARMLFRMRGVDIVALRLSSHDPHMKIGTRYVSHPFLPFALRPNDRREVVWTPPDWPFLAKPIVTHHWITRTNSWGFRGPEVSLEKPDNTVRIVCLGGSTTYDTTTDGQTWPEKLQRLLQVQDTTRNVEVLNFGMNASSLPFHLVTFVLQAVHFQPDLVVIYPGHNELWSGLGKKGFRADYSHHLGHWDDRRGSIQRRIPDWLLDSQFVLYLAVAFDRWRGVEYDLVRAIWRGAAKADDPLEGYWAFHNGLLTLRGAAAAHGAKLLVITPQWGFRGGEWEAMLVQRIRATAQEAGIPFFDAAALFPKGDNTLYVDDVHFSEKGGDLFAEMVAKTIRAQQLLP